MNHHNKFQRDRFLVILFSRAGQFVVLSVLVLLNVGLLNESSQSCEAAVLGPPSDNEVHQNGAQHCKR